MPIRSRRGLLSAVHQRLFRRKLTPPPPLPRSFGFLDGPTSGQPVDGLLQVHGWELRRTPGESVIEVSIDNQPIDTPARRVPRADVSKAFPDLSPFNPRPGFAVAIPTTPLSAGPHVVTVLAHDPEGAVEIARVEIEVRNDRSGDFYRRAFTTVDSERRRRKLERLLDILACPLCRTALSNESESQLRCGQCHRAFQLIDSVPIMVVGEPAYPVDASQLDSPASNHPYNPIVLPLLEETLARGGLALDVGSGCRTFGAVGLVQVEICTYPFTDVVNQSEQLPFRDESFDLVYSSAVTEHVRRPWVLAAEMQRVLKRGGTLYVDSAFLQPLHGYPSHYFNMTHLALRDLFAEVEVLSLRPEPWQHPWHALSWILSHALLDLPPDERRRLSAMPVGDFLQQLQQYCRQQPSELDAIHLPAHRVEELAAGFTLLGRKI